MTAGDIDRAWRAAIEAAAVSGARTRKLSGEALIRFLIAAEGGSLAKELHRAGINVTPAAITQRRAELTPAAFQSVFNYFNRACTDATLYKGYRLLAVDGSSINIPRNPAAPSFVRNDGAPKGYNQLHLNPLFDILNRVYVDSVVQPEPQKDEIGALVAMLQRNTFAQRTLIIADRGYESYNLIAHLQNKANTDFLIRVKQNHSAMREVARLPMFALDCKISFTITTSQTNADKQNGFIFLQVPKKSKAGAKTRRGRWDFPSPYPMSLRIVRFQLPNGEYETIATSLPPSFSAEEIKELYHLRWGIETSFRDLKYTVGLINLHGKSDAFCEQEIYAALTAFNFTSRICSSAVARQPKNGAYAYKVNFKMAVALCREFIRGRHMSSTQLVEQVERYLVPIRPDRQDERNLKVKGFSGFVYRVAA